MGSSSVKREVERRRLLEGLHLQAMEDNPLTDDEIAMFEMFDLEGWSDERRRDYIIAQFSGGSGRPAAAE